MSTSGSPSLGTDAAAGALASAPLLTCRGITKHFGGETAIERVNFTLQRGEVHGLVGSNGAGKSTLMKILAGALPDHEGTVELDGAAVTLDSPQAAQELGIYMIYQELSGIGQLSVAENLFLGRQPVNALGLVDWPAMVRRAGEYLSELGIEVDVRRRLDRYPLVVRQLVEIARGLHAGARILIMDEPTSALSPPEAQRLFALVRQVRAGGVAVVFISHFLDDVLAICDRVTVLKDGRLVETVEASLRRKDEIILAMLGRQLASDASQNERILPPRTTAAAVLAARGLVRPGVFDAFDGEVAAGECLGLYGFVGAGHQELSQALAQAQRAPAGSVHLESTPLVSGRTDLAIARGVVLVASDRGQTVFKKFANYQNVTLGHLGRCVGNWLIRRREAQVARPLLEEVGCQPADPLMPAGGLSGGNQQKVVFARWLAGPVKVLILDEPTRGMDVGAKADIMHLVARLKSEGAAVV